MTPKQRRVHDYLKRDAGWPAYRAGDWVPVWKLVADFRPKGWPNHETLGAVAELVSLGLAEKRATAKGNEIRVTVAGRAPHASDALADGLTLCPQHDHYHDLGYGCPTCDEVHGETGKKPEPRSGQP